QLKPNERSCIGQLCRHACIAFSSRGCPRFFAQCRSRSKIDEDRTVVSKISLKVACAPLALAVSFTATPAFAQETAEVIESGDAIIVTGTRIRRPDLESAVPVVAITAETIQQSGQTNLTDLLAQ